MIFPSGAEGQAPRPHALYAVDEAALEHSEGAATAPNIDPAAIQRAEAEASRRRRGEAPQDDGSLHDLLVIYTPDALEAVGGTTAMENLIDLGVTETNLSYETNDVGHRVRLVGTALTPTTEAEMAGNGDPRDLLQDPDDGFMDEVHPLRDRVRADLVKLIMDDGGGCGRTFIMAEVSLAFEAFAFCRTRYLCVSPTYSFQHELGHLQAGRHFYNGDATQGEPFDFNHGYVDFEKTRSTRSWARTA